MQLPFILAKIPPPEAADIAACLRCQNVPRQRRPRGLDAPKDGIFAKSVR